MRLRPTLVAIFKKNTLRLEPEPEPERPINVSLTLLKRSSYIKHIVQVAAGSDVRIALSEGENGARGGDTNFYTIVLGEWDNTRSVLNR